MLRPNSVTRLSAGITVAALAAALAWSVAGPGRDAAALRARYDDLCRRHAAARAAVMDQRRADAAAGGNGDADLSEMCRLADEARAVGVSMREAESGWSPGCQPAGASGPGGAGV